MVNYKNPKNIIKIYVKKYIQKKLKLMKRKMKETMATKILQILSVKNR